MTEEEERRKRLLEACKKINAPLPTLVGYMPEEELKKRQEETREWFEEQIKRDREMFKKAKKNEKKS